MDRSNRIIGIRIFKDERGLEHILRRDLMGNVHHLTAGIDIQDSPLHRSGVLTHQAEVGNQGNNPRWFFSQFLLLRTIYFYFLSFPYIFR